MVPDNEYTVLVPDSEYTDLSEYISMDNKDEYKYSSEYPQESLDSYEYGGGLSDFGEVSYRLFNGIL